MQTTLGSASCSAFAWSANTIKGPWLVGTFRHGTVALTKELKPRLLQTTTAWTCSRSKPLEARFLVFRTCPGSAKVQYLVGATAGGQRQMLADMMWAGTPSGTTSTRSARSQGRSRAPSKIPVSLFECTTCGLIPPVANLSGGKIEESARPACTAPLSPEVRSPRKKMLGSWTFSMLGTLGYWPRTRPGPGVAASTDRRF